MPNRSKEDLARALEQLSGGPTSKAEGEEQGRDATGPENKTDKTVGVPRPPGPVRPAAPAGQLPPVGRPSQPAGTAAPPPPRPPAALAVSDRPAVPPRIAHVETPSHPPPSSETVVDDDDAVIVPAPDPRVFLHKSNAPIGSHKQAGFGRSLRFRRTFIPILLTGGLICLALGTIHFIAWSAGENPLRALPGWLVALLFVFSVALWGLAIANMIVVKQMLEAEAQPAAP